jgi:hypothetical protein
MTIVLTYPPDVAVWTLNRVEETNCRRLVKREVHMSDKSETVNPNRSFDTLSFKDAELKVTEILQQSASYQEALKMLESIPDRKGVGVDLILTESILTESQSGTVKVSLEEGQPDAASYHRKDVGLLYSDGRIVTRQMPNVLPDLTIDK